MSFEKIRSLPASVRKFNTQAWEYEKKTSVSMALCVAVVFFIYGLLFLPVTGMEGAISRYVWGDLAGMGIVILVSLAYAWKLKYHYPQNQLKHIAWWGFSYHTFLFVSIFYLWITGNNVSITPLFIIIICLGFTWLHIWQYLIYITVTMILMLIFISLVEFDYFWFLEFLILYLFAVSLHLFHVDQQCQLFQYQQLIEADRDRDSLTGLLNRRALEETFLKSRQSTPKLAAILLDLDCFKGVNDSYGHAAGDKALTQAAALFRRVFRREDLIARIGGDEFFILIRLYEDAQEVLTARLRSLLNQLPVEFESEKGRVDITLSIGAYLTEDSPEIGLEALFAQADKAMYQVKEEGRNAAILRTEDGKIIHLKKDA